MGNYLFECLLGFFFLVMVSILFGLVIRRLKTTTQKFFGIDYNAPLQIFVSTHKDPTTITGRVFTAEEQEVAVDFKRALERQFPELITFVARRLDIDLESPEITIEGSPTEQIDIPDYSGSLLLIGGPTRNNLTEVYLRIIDPWLTFDDNRKIFLSRNSPSGQWMELEDSGELAILQKLYFGENCVFFAFGYGEIETKEVVRYLKNNWKNLASKYDDKPFTILFRVDGRRLTIKEEFFNRWDNNSLVSAD